MLKYINFITHWKYANSILFHAIDFDSHTKFIVACEVSSFVNSIQRRFKDLFLRLSRYKNPKLLFRISTNIISGWSPFNVIIFFAANFGFHAKARHVGKLVSRSKQTFRKRKFPPPDNRTTSHATWQDTGYTPTHVHKLLTFNKLYVLCSWVMQ